jgi:putative endopeptidase
MPEKDYYLRTGDKDVQIRASTSPTSPKCSPSPAARPSRRRDAQNIMAWRPRSPRPRSASSICASRRRPITCSPSPPSTANLPGFNFAAFEDAIHSPHVTEINNSTPDFWPEMLKQIQHHPHIAPSRPTSATTCSPPSPAQPSRTPSTTRTSTSTAASSAASPSSAPLEALLQRRRRRLGEALGKVYVDQYFAGDSKAKMLQMVHDIEPPWASDIDQIDWMSPATKVRAKEKLAAVANKIGYPDKWRDYSKLTIKPDDALGNELRANAFENDRQLNKIGKPVDKASGR